MEIDFVIRIEYDHLTVEGFFVVLACETYHVEAIKFPIHGLNENFYGSHVNK